MRTRRRRRRPVAAVDAVSARARRIARVEGRPHRDGAVRAHRRAAGPADARIRTPSSSFSITSTQESPFRLEDDTSWDTNIELGIAWGMRLIEKDEELHGKSPNAKAFVLVTDGQAWSGEVARALKTRPHQRVPIFVVGVGTTAGGVHPGAGAEAERHVAGRTADPRGARSRVADARSPMPAAASTWSSIARATARSRTGSSTRRARRAGSRGLEVANEELYWRFLLAAAAFMVARPAVPAGEGGAVAPGRRRRRRTHAGLDADTLRSRHEGRECPASAGW